MPAAATPRIQLANKLNGVHKAKVCSDRLAIYGVKINAFIKHAQRKSDQVEHDEPPQPFMQHVPIGQSCLGWVRGDLMEELRRNCKDGTPWWRALDETILNQIDGPILKLPFGVDQCANDLAEKTLAKLTRCILANEYEELFVALEQVEK